MFVVNPALTTIVAALGAAEKALEGAEQQCRIHGTDFGYSGFSFSQPRCDSCKQPYRVVHALGLIRSASETRLERGDPGE